MLANGAFVRMIPSHQFDTCQPPFTFIQVTRKRYAPTVVAITEFVTSHEARACAHPTAWVIAVNVVPLDLEVVRVLQNMPVALAVVCM